MDIHLSVSNAFSRYADRRRPKLARLSLVEFRNQRDPKGYHLERLAGQPFMIRRNGRVQEELKDCLPLRGREYLEFARIRDADEALEFVQRHGPLTDLGNAIDENCGERADGLVELARYFREILEAAKEGPPRLSDELLGILSLMAQGDRKTLIWDPVERRMVWQSRPLHDLNSSLWAQLIQAVTRGDQLRTCEHCGVWFEVGIGAGRRADAKFCSDEHRAAFNNRARSRRP